MTIWAILSFILSLLFLRWFLRWFLGIGASDQRLESLELDIRTLRGALPSEVLPRKVSVYGNRIPRRLTGLSEELKVIVNEQTHSVALEPNELKTLDLSPDLNSGYDNSIVLSGDGETIDHFATVVLST